MPVCVMQCSVKYSYCLPETPLSAASLTVLLMGWWLLGVCEVLDVVPFDVSHEPAFVDVASGSHVCGIPWSYEEGNGAHHD